MFMSRLERRRPRAAIRGLSRHPSLRRAPDCFGERAVAVAGIGERMRLRRVLLRLDHEPAARSPAARRSTAAKSTMPSPGTVKTPATTESRKLQSPRERLAHDGFAHVLAVHMRDARAVAARERDRIGAGEGRVPGIEQQLQRVAGLRHQPVDLGSRPARSCPCGGDRRARAPPPRSSPQAASARAPKCRHCAASSARAARERHRAVAMHRVARLGEDQHRAAHRAQQVEMRPHRRHLVLAASVRARRPNTSRRRDRARAAAARRAARRPRAGICARARCPRTRPPAPPRGRSRAASRRRVRADRRSTRRSGWCRGGSCSFPENLRAARLLVVPRAARTSARAETSGTPTSHQCPPASVLAGGIGLDHDDAGALPPRAPGRAPLPAPRCCRRARRSRRGFRHGRGNRRTDGTRRSRLLNAAPPVARCNRLMQPKPRLSSTTIGQLEAALHRGRDLGIHHQIAAVADHDDHLGAPAARASRRARRRSRSPCRRSRIPGGSAPAAPACQSLCNSPGSPPAAQTTMQSSPSVRCTAPITCASEGSAALPGSVAARTSRSQAARQFLRAARPFRGRAMLAERSLQRFERDARHRRPAAARMLGRRRRPAR